MQLTNRISRQAAALILLVILYLAGCDNTFKPLQQNDQYAFSMYGTLDLHADTQWVRVMPIGESLIPTNPESNNTVVTLTRESTGETTILNDSLFVFGGNAYVWNYWTSMPLQPNEEYILCAEAPDGRQSTAHVMVPSFLALPLVNYSEESDVAVITGSSVDPLVMLDTRFKVEVITEVGPAPEMELVFSHLDGVYVDQNGKFSFTMEVTYSVAIRLEGVRPGEFIIKSKELLIATGSEDWPDLSDLNEEGIVLPDVVSNVENGTGFVAGIALRRVPLKSCYNEEGKLTACQELD